jgi:hypothetical protein
MDRNTKEIKWKQRESNLKVMDRYRKEIKGKQRESAL